MKLSKGIVKELERERDGWKAEHDDLMDKYNRLAEELEAFRAEDKPTLFSKLASANDSLRKEINELHQCLRDADEERDEAKKHAEQVMDDFKKLHEKYKTDIEAYEQEFSHMKEKHDRLLDYVRLGE